MEKEESKTDTQIRIRKAGHDDVDALKKVAARAFDSAVFCSYPKQASYR